MFISSEHSLSWRDAARQNYIKHCWNPVVMSVRRVHSLPKMFEFLSRNDAVCMQKFTVPNAHVTLTRGTLQTLTLLRLYGCTVCTGMITYENAIPWESRQE